MKSRDHHVIFEVIGGIGNQLFGLAAAVYFEDLHGRPFKISMREVDKGITVHGVSIINFDLPFCFIEENDKNRYISRNIRRFIFKLDKLLKVKTQYSRKLLCIYSSNVQGLDPTLAEKPGVMRYQGYFQSFVYAAALKRRLNSRPFELKSKSNWFLEMKSRALVEKPIMMHVRRGDYINQVDDFGVLGPSYFEASLSVVRRVLPENPIWIFSDEIERARDELSSLKREECTWISPPNSSPPEESLILMQFGVGHIISNSTFSWWAAYSSNTTSIVIAPRPWMRGIQEPAALIPHHWIRIDSDWI